MIRRKQPLNFPSFIFAKTKYVGNGERGRDDFLHSWVKRNKPHLVIKSHILSTRSGCVRNWLVAGLSTILHNRIVPQSLVRRGVGINISAKMAWFWHSLSKCHGREARQTSKPQNRLKAFVWYWTVLPHRAQIICLNPINITHLGCTSQLSYPIIWSQHYLKYNELSHCNRAQTNMNSNKNITQWLLFSSWPWYFDRRWFWG